MLNKTQLKAIADQLSIDVDNYCIRKFGQERLGRRLGASQIGNECRRAIWYAFRWCKKEEKTPRMLRLLNRGHLEEARFLDYLEGIGCKVSPFDKTKHLFIDPADSNKYIVVGEDEALFNELNTKGISNVSKDSAHIKRANEEFNIDFPVQWQVNAVEGHFGGSMDGRGYLPEHYPIKEEILFEFKTANDKSHNDLTAKGMQQSKEEHYYQTCTYGYLSGFNYVCYVAVNKNNDALHIEIVPLNRKTGELAVMKAESIIFSQTPPPKLYENPTYFKCKYMCPFSSICHGNEQINRNCRSCKHAKPAKNKQWICEKHNNVFPDAETMAKEYQCWESIC